MMKALLGRGFLIGPLATAHEGATEGATRAGASACVTKRTGALGSTHA